MSTSGRENEMLVICQGRLDHFSFPIGPFTLALTPGVASIYVAASQSSFSMVLLSGTPLAITVEFVKRRSEVECKSLGFLQAVASSIAAGGVHVLMLATSWRVTCETRENLLFLLLAESSLTAMRIVIINRIEKGLLGEGVNRKYRQNYFDFYHKRIPTK